MDGTRLRLEWLRNQSLLGALPTFWLGFVIVRYSRTSFNTVLSPYNPGMDIAWAISWIAVLAAVLLSAALLKRSLFNWTWAGLLGGAALAVIVLSQTAGPALAALLVLTVSAGFGEFVLQRSGLDSTTLVERLVLTAPIGIGFLALGQLALASLGLFTVMTSWLLVLALAIPGALGLRRLLACPLEDGLRGQSLAIVPCGYLFLLNLSWATAPEIQFDATNVHLAVPHLYLQDGALIDLPYFWNSYMAHLLDMVFGLCLALGGALAPKFLILGFGVLALAGVYVIGRRLFNNEVGMWAAVLFYSTPLVIWSSSTTYLDLAQAFFITASVIAFLQWHSTSRWAWMGASGWIGGVAVGTKVAAIATLIVFPLIALARAFRQLFHGRQSGTRAASFRPFVAYVVLMLIVAAPWYLVVYLQTGNPFFPLLNKVFRSPHWPIINTSLDWPSFGIGTSFGSMLRLPFRLTLDTIRFGSARGAVGLTMLLAFPFALGYLWKGTLPQRAFLAAIGVHMTVWMFTAQYARYYISILPLVGVVGVAVFLAADSGFFAWCNRVLLLIGVLAQAPIASVLFWNIPERFPVSRALGRESYEAFLTRGLPGSGAARYLNTVWKPGEKILGVGVENLRFYFNGPVYTQYYLNLENSGAATPEDLQARVLQDGFRYIVSLNAELQIPLPWVPYVGPEFIRRFWEEAYRDETTTVLRIRQGSPRP